MHTYLIRQMSFEMLYWTQDIVYKVNYYRSDKMKRKSCDIVFKQDRVF